MELENALREFYEQYDEDNRLMSRHGQVEYLTTMEYIHRYLRPGMRILEVGAATGRYSHALAREGYRVDAVELVEKNIRQFRANTQPGEAVTICQGDARCLPFAGDTYDITLVLGPLYHLFTREDKLAALGEAIRVTKPGGVVFVSYCGNDATVLQFVFLRGMYADPRYQSLIDPQTFKAGSDPTELFELHRPEEVAALRSRFAVMPLHYVATDGFANYIRPQLAQMQEEVYRAYLRYHLATCERADMVGYSNHTLDIFRKSAPMLRHIGTQTLETPRLLLRRFTREDAPAMFRNWTSDPEVTRFLTWPTHDSQAVTQEVLDTWVEAYARQDCYRWAIVWKESGQPIGSIDGVRQDDRVGRIEIGYCIGSAWWGRGIMTEALGAVIDFCFHRVGYQRVEACHDVANPASGAVMAKCGMAREGTLRRGGINNQGLCDLVWYAILKP